MDHPFPHLHIKLYYCTSGGNKLEIPAQTTRMSYIRGTSVIGGVFFRTEKTFIRPIALSTCIRALAI